MKQKYIFFSILVCFFFISKYSHAYFGIGALLPLIGNAIVFIFIGVVAVIGFLAYIKKKKTLKNKSSDKNKKNKTI